MEIAISGVEERYYNASVQVLLDDARRYQVGYVELVYPNGIAVEGLQRSLALIAESGVRVAAVSTHAYLIGVQDVAARQRQLSEAIGVARSVGAPLVNTYFGHSHARDDDGLIALYAERLAPCLRQATDAGITIVLENECDVTNEDPARSDITRRPESLRALVERIGSSSFRLNLDATNAYIAGVEPFPYLYDVVREYIGYVHIKDGATYNPRVHTGRHVYPEQSGQYVCVTLGDGAINHEGLLGRLKADGYDGFLTLEPHVPLAEFDGALARSIPYLRKFQ